MSLLWTSGREERGLEAERWAVHTQVLENERDCWDTWVPGRPLSPWLWGLAHSLRASASHELSEGAVPDNVKRSSPALTFYSH